MRMIAGIAGSLLLLAGCGSEANPQSISTPQNSAKQNAAEQNAQPVQPTSAANDEPWSKIDPCTLLSASEITGYLGPSASRAGTKSQKFGRPLCTWTGRDRDKVNIQIWQPPAKELIADPAKTTLPVDGKVGYITSSTAASCLLEVDGGPAFLSMEVAAFVVTPPSSTVDTTCKKVAATLAGVVGRLDW